MKVFITGALGGIGALLVPELIKQKHSVSYFVLSGKKNKKITQGVRVFYGDIKKKSDIVGAIKGYDVIIHLAFASPDICRKKPSLAYKINVEGTKNLIQIAEESCKDVKIIFPSSVSTYFYELNKNSKKIKSLRYIEYTKQKLECEKIIKSSSLNWSILKIGAILPVEFPIPSNLLNIPADTRFQFIHIKDVIVALINASKIKKSNKEILLIGGGKDFRMRYKDFVRDIFRIAGFKIPKDNEFSFKSYLTDYFDTTKSQKILRYQKHHYKNFLKEMRHKAKNNKKFIIL